MEEVIVTWQDLSWWKCINICCWVAIAGIPKFSYFHFTFLTCCFAFIETSLSPLGRQHFHFIFWNISFSSSFFCTVYPASYIALWLFLWELCSNMNFHPMPNQDWDNKLGNPEGAIFWTCHSNLVSRGPGSGASGFSSSSSTSASGSSSSWTSHLVWVSRDRRSPRKQTLVAINVFEGSN